MQSTLAPPVTSTESAPPASLDDTLAAMRQADLATYRELVIETVETGAVPDAAILRTVLTNAGRTRDQFRADVETFHQRRQAADALAAAESVASGRKSIRDRINSLSADLDARRAEFEKTIAPLKREIGELQDSLSAGKTASGDVSRAMGALGRTADAAIERDIMDLRHRIVKLTRRDEHLRSYGIRRPIGEDKVREFSHLHHGDTEVDREQTQAARDEVRAELASLNEQIESLNRRKFVWQNGQLT